LHFLTLLSTRTSHRGAATVRIEFHNRKFLQWKFSIGSIGVTRNISDSATIAQLASPRKMIGSEDTIVIRPARFNAVGPCVERAAALTG
jgi:hypothetical protein